MLTDILPLLTDSVEHLPTIQRDIHGKIIEGAPGTMHRAKVIRKPGVIPAPASRDLMPQANATVWLIDHPSDVSIGQRFRLDAEPIPLDVIGVEVRVEGSMTLTKVHLK